MSRRQILRVTERQSHPVIGVLPLLNQGRNLVDQQLPSPAASHLGDLPAAPSGSTPLLRPPARPTGTGAAPSGDTPLLPSPSRPVGTGAAGQEVLVPPHGADEEPTVDERLSIMVPPHGADEERQQALMWPPGGPAAEKGQSCCAAIPLPLTFQQHPESLHKFKIRFSGNKTFFTRMHMLSVKR